MEDIKSNGKWQPTREDMTKNEEKAMLIYKYILFNINGYSKEELEEMDNEEVYGDGIYIGILDFINGKKTNYATYA